ncbi:MAG: hypothetical protein IJ244_00690 [Bacteroidaceae bacterium]|nr:hypothetical protein [Bacteroidaceae bacterium]
MDEQKFPTPAGSRLSFSVDTLSFDTVFSGIGTPTRSFMVYNSGSDGVSITGVAFDGGGSQGFRVNVDGVYINGNLAQSIDCRAKDSLRVFVELTPQAFDADEPIETTAHLWFALANGERQEVVLTAHCQSVIVLRALHVSADTTFSVQRPYLVYDSLTVDEGVMFTVSEGVRFYFHHDAFLRVDGSLVAQGSLQRPIVFRGDRTDLMFASQPYDRVPGQWQGIRFSSSSYDNHMNYCDVHSGTFGLRLDSSSVEREKLRLENSVVHNMSGDCITAFSSRLFVGNSQISNAGGNCITLYGGDTEFIHCTVAGFCPFYVMRGAALIYSNEYHNQPYPIHRLSVRNCIVTGYSEDEIFGNQSADFPQAAFNYYYQNSLLCTTPVSDDPLIVGCLWDNAKDLCREKNFPAFNLDELIYSFSLVSTSRAIGGADAQLSSIYYPFDRQGHPRLSDGMADMGCYEYVESTNDR